MTCAPYVRHVFGGCGGLQAYEVGRQLTRNIIILFFIHCCDFSCPLFFFQTHKSSSSKSGCRFSIYVASTTLSSSVRSDAPSKLREEHGYIACSVLWLIVDCAQLSKGGIFLHFVHGPRNRPRQHRPTYPGMALPCAATLVPGHLTGSPPRVLSLFCPPRVVVIPN
jgi:hypothetical protein